MFELTPVDCCVCLVCLFNSCGYRGRSGAEGSLFRGVSLSDASLAGELDQLSIWPRKVQSGYVGQLPVSSLEFSVVGMTSMEREFNIHLVDRALHFQVYNFVLNESIVVNRVRVERRRRAANAWR